jgi:hypothetical protein
MFNLTDEQARKAIEELRHLFGTVIMEAPEYVPSVEDGLATLRKYSSPARASAASLPQPSAGQPSDWIVACEELRPENHELGGSYKVTMHSGKVWHTTEKPPSAGQTEGK